MRQSRDKTTGIQYLCVILCMMRILLKILEMCSDCLQIHGFVLCSDDNKIVVQHRVAHYIKNSNTNFLPVTSLFHGII